MKKRLLSMIPMILAVSLLISIVGCAVGNGPATIDPVPAENPEPIEEPAATEGLPQAEEVETQVVNKQPDPTEPESAPEGTVLVIFGDGVASQTNWTLEQLQELEAGYLEIKYSTTRNWPTYSHMTGHGVSLRYLLEYAGLLDSAKTFVFSAPDGYRVNITREQIFEARIAYTEHNVDNSSGAVEVEPMIAWVWGDKDDVLPEDIRPLFGQKGREDVNTAASVKGLFRIEVLTWDIGIWDLPDVSIPSGSTVAPGTELELIHPQMDNTGLYYTIDGSYPGYDSKLYNVSTSYFQPDLIVPIVIDKNVTIKVFAGGLGKADSAIATFTYTVG